METKDWVSILVAGIILGTLGWLGTQLFDMKGTLARVDERVIAIADEMPEIGRYAAWRETEAPIKGAVVTSKPMKDLNNNFYITIHVLNASSNMNQRYKVSLANQDGKQVTCSIIGNAVMHDSSSLSFERLMYFSKKAGNKIEIPGSIDAKSSFVFRTCDTESFIPIISKYIGKPEDVEQAVYLGNWNELTKELPKIDVRKNQSPKK